MELHSLRAPPLAPLALHWQWSRLEELSPTELYAALAARQQVFAVEQNCAFQDADGHDPYAWHLCAWTQDSKACADTNTPARSGPALLAGYLRLLDPGRKYAEPSIGRVLTVAPYRRVGLGRLLMSEGLARTRLTWPGQSIRIGAQHRLEPFYESLGFRTVSAPYIEDGIPHIEMVADP